jgi:putative endonuclease
MKNYYVYILASKKDGVLYIGVTNDLIRRVFEHKESKNLGFTLKYFVKKLVWYEVFSDIEDAIAQEKRMKKWKREYKINIIQERNPEWKDLFDEIIS